MVRSPVSDHGSPLHQIRVFFYVWRRFFFSQLKMESPVPNYHPSHFWGRPWKIFQGVFGEVSVTSFLGFPICTFSSTWDFGREIGLKTAVWTDHPPQKKRHFEKSRFKISKVVAISVHELLPFASKSPKKKGDSERLRPWQPIYSSFCGMSFQPPPSLCLLIFMK